MVAAGLERPPEGAVEVVGTSHGASRYLAPVAPGLLLFAGVGCYWSYVDREECVPTPGCLEGAVAVCLDEVATIVPGGPADDPACRSIEVTGTEDCSSPAGGVHIVRRAGGSDMVWVEATVLEVPSGVALSGYSAPGSGPACDPCGGGGVRYDNPVPGDTYVVDFGAPPGLSEIELTYLGGGVRYRVVACAHD
ncbi:MAG: hypothetical protein HY907_11020 [Deltaproteobacteria bacterium]|nr:hypothetical protein [Deltaproteobacteria bacterium]